MGPKRDILGELKQAATKTSLHFCTSSHRAEHWFFFGHGRDFESDVKEPMVKGDFYWPAMPEPDNQDLYSTPYPSQTFWMIGCCGHVKSLIDIILRFCTLIGGFNTKLLKLR